MVKRDKKGKKEEARVRGTGKYCGKNKSKSASGEQSGAKE